MQREARHMKKSVFIKCAAVLLCSVCTVFSLGACAVDGDGGQGGRNGGYGLETERPLFDARTTVFDHLEGNDGETIGADFQVYLSGEEGQFLFIELNRDVDAQMEFTFTKDEGAAELGVDPGDGGERISFNLGVDAVDEEKSYVEDISLKSGLNSFYVAGEGCTCKISCSIAGVDPDSRVYVGVYPKEYTVSAPR